MNEPDTSRYESFVPIDFRSIQEAGKLPRVPTKELSREKAGKNPAPRATLKVASKTCTHEVDAAGFDECLECETSIAEASGDLTDWPGFSERSGRLSSCQSEASIDEEEETCRTTVIKNDEQTEEGQTDDCHSIYDDDEEHVELVDRADIATQQVEKSCASDVVPDPEGQSSHICFPECPKSCTLCGHDPEVQSEASMCQLQDAAAGLHRRCPSDSSYFGTASETRSITSDLSNGKSPRDGRKKRLWRPPRHRRHYSDFASFPTHHPNQTFIQRNASFSNASPFHSPSLQSPPPSHYPPLSEWQPSPQPLALPPSPYGPLGPVQILLTPVTQAGVYDYACVPDGVTYTTHDASGPLYAPSPYHRHHPFPSYPFPSSADPQLHMPVQLLQAYYHDQPQQMVLQPAQMYSPPSHATYPPSPSTYPTSSPANCPSNRREPGSDLLFGQPKGMANPQKCMNSKNQGQGQGQDPNPSAQPVPQPHGPAGTGAESESESEPGATAVPSVPVHQLEERIESLVDEFGVLAPELSLLSEIIKNDRAGISVRNKARAAVAGSNNL